MTIDKLKEALSNQASFRLKQAIKLIFVDFIDDWNKASVFPLSLRDELNERVPLLIEADLFLSKDGLSGKAMIKLSDDLKLETTLMSHEDGRNTVCLSSQVGCPLACKFCATGRMGFKRNLDYSEILIQALFWSRFLKQKGLRITNVVFMGMGEPFLNYDNVFKSIKFLHDADLFNISSKKIAVSTIGLINEIKKMTKEKTIVDLAISLHAASDVLRSKLMPYTKNHPLKDLFEAIDFYIDKTGRKVMLEYLLIKDVNDTDKDIELLIKLLSGRKLLLLNLIKYNETGSFKPSDRKTILKFKNHLKREGINVIERHRFNEDVFGACGQLALKSRS